MTAFTDPEVEALIGGASAPLEAEMLGGGYEGASRVDRDLALWDAPMRSADLDLLPDKNTIDMRARDVQRNDAYVAAGAQLHRDNIVGSMFLLNAKPDFKVLGLDEAWAAEFQEEVEAKFTLYAESPRRWIDASRHNTLTDLVRLAIGIYTMSGEVLSTAEWLRDANRPYNTAIQMIDVDRLSNPVGQMNTQFLRGGVRRNKWGAAIGYYIQVAHPHDFTWAQNVWDWKYVPAAKPWGRQQVIHIFEQFRPDQSRGVSEMVSALKEIRVTKKYRDIVLQNAVVNATYAASIESDLPSDVVFNAMGGGNLDSSATTAINQYAVAFLKSIDQYAASARNMRLDGVKIPHLFPGTKLHLQNAGTPGGVGGDFEKSLLRYIAANLGVSYEQLSRDYSSTNYSSARAAMLETWKFMQSRKRAVADRYASSIYMLWLEEAINKGDIKSLPRNAPSWYQGMNAEAYAKCDWIGASRGQVDEMKETQAAVLRIRSGLSTYEDEISRMGRDYRKVFAQQQRERADRKERGLDPLPATTSSATPGSSSDTNAPAQAEGAAHAE